MASDEWTLLWAGALLASLAAGTVAGAALVRSVVRDRGGEAHRWSRVLVIAGAVAFCTSLALAVNLYRLNA